MDYFLLALVVVACVAFALLNGMNDLSGIIATLIATRALPARKAQLLGALGVTFGVVFGAAKVAETVATHLVHLDRGGFTGAPALAVWLGGISGAVVWGLAARKLGVPTSATHAFVGSLCGATMLASRQAGLINWGLDGVAKVGLGLVCSPLVGGALGFLLFRGLAALLRRATPRVEWILKRGECLAVFAQAYSYGLNDAQKVMGVLMGALMATPGVSGLDPHAKFGVLLWVKLLAAGAVIVGTMIGSSKIIRTMGRGLFHVKPAEALSGQIAAAVSVFGASLTGAPVSSTQVTSSALVGVGGAWRPRHVRWKKVREILVTWVLTFPLAAGIGAVVTWMIRLLPGAQ